ncbi:hypothetical protein KY284_003772 [Solanum tuberosum]|nr:hypothetical protein KY284_003772 [Solanum tuberosum]
MRDGRGGGEFFEEEEEVGEAGVGRGLTEFKKDKEWCGWGFEEQEIEWRWRVSKKEKEGEEFVEKKKGMVQMVIEGGGRGRWGVRKKKG